MEKLGLIRKNKYKEYVFHTVFFLIAVLSMQLNSIIFKIALVLLLLMIINKPIEYVPIVFIVMNFGEIYLPFNLPLTNTMYVLFTFTLILFLIKRYMGNRDDYFNWSLLLVCIGLGCITALAIIFSSTVSLTTLVSLISNYFLFFLFSLIRNVNIKNLTNKIVISTMVILIFIFVLFALNKLPYIENRLSFSQNMNVNTFGLMLNQFSIVILVGLFYSKNHMFKILLFVVFLGTVYLLFLTGSRSSLVGLLVVAVLFLITTKKMNIKRKALIFAIGVILFVVFWTLGGISELFLYRSGSSGRTDIWRVLIKYIIPQNFILGVGFEPSQLNSLLKVYGMKNSLAHNIILAVLVQGGIFYLAFFLLVVSYCFNKGVKTIRQNEQNCLPFLLLLSLLSIGVFEDVYQAKFFWCTMGLVILYANNTCQKTNLELGHRLQNK